MNRVGNEVKLSYAHRNGIKGKDIGIAILDTGECVTLLSHLLSCRRCQVKFGMYLFYGRICMIEEYKTDKIIIFFNEKNNQ